MDYNPSIFKAYDIRGLVGKDFDLEFVERLGRAFVLHTGARTIVLGRDMRGTSPEYADAIARGAMKQGADVIDIGMVSTPMFYFAVADYELHDAGIMVTASHNPAEYNGFKMVDGQAQPFGRDSGGLEIERLVVKNEFPEVKEGTLIQTDITEDYLARLWSLVPPEDIAGLKIVADAGNGMSGVILPRIFERLNVEVHPLYWEPDGTFPHHEANPLKEETLADLKKKMKEVGADLGVAFDGDSDRVGFVDETGRTVAAFETLALLAKLLLARHPGRKVTCDIRCSNSVIETVRELGSDCVITPVGHALIKPYMRREQAIVGGELSGHFYFGEFNGAENSDYVMLLFLQLLARTKKPLSEYVTPFRRYFHSGEINFTVADKAGKIAAVKEKYAPSARAVNEIDGLRLDFDGWWCSIRASNTEPLLRLNVEAAAHELMEEKKNELTALITA